MEALPFCLTSAAILLLLLSACGGGSLSDPLKGTAWTLISIDNTPSFENTTVTVEFTDGKIGGSSGCNSYGGSYKLSGENFTTDSIAMTLMACTDEGVMEQESVFLDHLQNAQTFKLFEDKLQMFISEGRSLTFIRNS